MPQAHGDVIDIDTTLKALPPTDPLVQKYGTKPAAVVAFMRSALEADPRAQFLVFSEWDAALELVARTLSLNGLGNAICGGSPQNRSSYTMPLRFGVWGVHVPPLRAPFNNSAPLGGGGGCPHPNPLDPPPLSDGGKFFSGPLANQKFSLEPSAPVGFGEKKFRRL